MVIQESNLKKKNNQKFQTDNKFNENSKILSISFLSNLSASGVINNQ